MLLICKEHVRERVPEVLNICRTLASGTALRRCAILMPVSSHRKGILSKKKETVERDKTGDGGHSSKPGDCCNLRRFGSSRISCAHVCKIISLTNGLK